MKGTTAPFWVQGKALLLDYPPSTIFTIASALPYGA